VGLKATGLPPRSSPDPSAGTRVALAHGAIGIRDNYISSARPCRRVRKLLASQSCTEGVSCDTAALDCSSKFQVAPLAAALHHFSTLDHRQVNLRGHSAFAKSTAHTALFLSPQRSSRHREASTGSCHHNIHSTSPAGTRAFDHAALPLPRPPLMQDTRYGLCYARSTMGARFLRGHRSLERHVVM
jgi:hypothetical protein